MRSSLVLLSLAATALGEPFKQWVRNNADASKFNDVLTNNFDIVQEYENADEITVFVPTNAAMSQYQKENKYATGNGGFSADLLRYHAVVGKHKVKNLQTDGPFLPTLYQPGTVSGGQVIQFQAVGSEAGTVYAFSGLNNNASIKGTDFNIKNGYVHFINKVLTLPASVEETAAAAGLTSFAGALVTSGVNSIGNDATWLAPNNGAFQRVAGALSSNLGGILRYHDVTGGPLYTSDINKTSYGTAQGTQVHFTYGAGASNLYANMAAVLQANILTSNGVMHVIDQVLNPNNAKSGTDDQPAFSSASAAPTPPYTQAAAAVQTQGGTYESSAPHAPPGSIAGSQAVEAYDQSAASRSTLSLITLASVVAGCMLVLLKN